MYYRRRSIFSLIGIVIVIISVILSSTKEHTLICDLPTKLCTTHHKNVLGLETVKNHMNPYDIQDIETIVYSKKRHKKHGYNYVNYYKVCFIDAQQRKDCFYETSSVNDANYVVDDLKRMFSTCKNCKEIKYDLKNHVKL